MEIIKYTSEQHDLLLEEILQTSFDADTTFHLGEGMRDGPPGYDDGKLLKRVKADAALSIYLLQEVTIVGLIVVNYKQRELCYFCLKPDSIGKGLGSHAWQLFEKLHPVDYWRLETPAYSHRNQNFYEKNGFKKIGQKRYSEESISYIYQKNFAN
jgi:ribosomal protein S18 acetylase RimI-like enzyme